MRRPLRAQLKRFAEGITNRTRPAVTLQRQIHRVQRLLGSGLRPPARHVALREMHGVPTSPLPLVARHRLLPPVAETDTEATADAAWAALRALRSTRPQSTLPQAPLPPSRPRYASPAREKASEAQKLPGELVASPGPIAAASPPLTVLPTPPAAPKAAGSVPPRPLARTATRSTAEMAAEQPPASEPPSPSPPVPMQTVRPAPPPPTTTEQPIVQQASKAAVPEASRPLSKRSGTQRTVESPAPPQPVPRPMPRAETRTKSPSIQRQTAPEPPVGAWEPAALERAGPEGSLASKPEVVPLSIGAPEMPPVTEPRLSPPAEPGVQPKPPASPPKSSPLPLPLARPAAPSTHPTLAQPAAPKPSPASTPLVRPQRLIPPRQPIGRRPASPPVTYRQPVTPPRVQRTVEAPDTEPAIAPPQSIGERPHRAEVIPTAAPESTAESPVMPAPSLEPQEAVRPGRGPAELAQRTVARHRRSIETFGYPFDSAQDRPSRQSPARPTSAVESEPASRPSPTTSPVQRPPARRETAPPPMPPVVSRATRERPTPVMPFGPPSGKLPSGELSFEVPPATEPAAAVTKPGPVIVQRMVSSRQDLRQALQPTLAPIVVQAAPEAPAAGPAPETREKKGEGESQDLESLAREVYRLVRRRLTIERERERGRL